MMRGVGGGGGGGAVHFEGRGVHLHYCSSSSGGHKASLRPCYTG